VNTNQPFSFVESEETRLYSKLGPVSVGSLMKYMEATAALVRKKVADALPEQFGVVFDGWSHNSMHYIGVFSVWGNANCRREALLGLLPLMDGVRIDNCSAQSHVLFLKDILESYEKSSSNVLFLCGDNCACNKLISDITQIPLLGCASHRLNLAVQRHLNNNYKEGIDKVQMLMGKLRHATKKYSFL
jgi:hypothetical protein